jgi:hypothetical protein
MIGEALKSYHFARELVPENEVYKRHHEARFKEYQFQQFMLQEHRREQFLRVTDSALHPAGCICMKCRHAQVLPNQSPLFPGHPRGCQCSECREARTMAHPTGILGHPIYCGCAGCRRIRGSQLPMFPGLPGLINPYL